MSSPNSVVVKMTADSLCFQGVCEEDLDTALNISISIFFIIKLCIIYSLKYACAHS